MPSRVISISRAIAASGEDIARQVAEQLQYRYVDNEIITQAAAHAGVSPQAIEQVEHSRSLISRIVESLALSSVGSSAGLGGGGIWPDDAPILSPSASYQRLIEQVIRQTAEEGNVVIVAHAASIPLAGMSDLLRVLVTASPAVRAARLQGEGTDARRAEKAIEDSDRERREYLRRFYGIQQELPTHYDLVINTDTLASAQAVRLILTAAAM